MRRRFGGRWRAIGWLLLPMGAALQVWAPPSWAEAWFTHLYPPVASALAATCGRLPFSLAELLLLLLTALGVVGVVRGVRARRPWRARLSTGTLETVAFAGYALFAFTLLWGLAYRRADLETRLRIPTGGTPAELVATARWLASETARLAPAGPADTPTRLPYSPRELDALVAQAYACAPELQGAPVTFAPAKAAWFSPLLSRLGIEGIYIPFTGEPHYNARIPDAELPFTIAHEKAHQQGFAPENEASFAAFLALRASPDPLLRYGGFFAASFHALRAVSRACPDAAPEIRGLLQGRPAADLAAMREFWEAYRGPAVQVSQRANDLYLRAAGVPEGVRSYDAVTDLLVGYHRQLSGAPAAAR